MKTFHVPITHEYIQNLTEFDLEFIDWSSSLDNPSFYDKVKNTVYDDDFDEYANEVESDELTDEERMMIEKSMSAVTIEENKTADESFTPVESSSEDPNDWEEV